MVEEITGAKKGVRGLGVQKERVEIRDVCF